MVFAQLNLIRKIVGVIGNLTAICLLISPTPTFIGIVKKKSVENYSPIPYLATLVNCLVRLFYGLPMVHPDSTLVITISVIGIAIEIVFLIIFFVYCDRKNQRLVMSCVLAAEIVFVAILVALVLTLQHTTDQRTVSVGIVCIIFTTMVYVAPLFVMKRVIKTKSLEFMPFWLSLACLINASVWTIYGLVPFDPFMAIPNGIGCVLGVAQLILYGIYYKSTKRIMAERQKLPGYIGEVSSLSGQLDQSGSEHIESFNRRVNGI